MSRDVRSFVGNITIAGINTPRDIDHARWTGLGPPANESFQRRHISNPIAEYSHPLQDLDLVNVPLRIDG